MTPPSPGRVLSVERLATLLLLAVYVVWVLSLPAWPSQDGPVHLYYTHVLGQLLGHSGGAYTQFFYIKHLLPPYALYYYLLLVLSHAVSLLLADRLVICAYLVLFLTGFHALARALGPSGRAADRATLLATVLLLNWPLGMGFVNYCLSLALSLWALAVWFRRPAGTPLRRGIAFLWLVVLITLAHPVPLLLVLGMCALDLLSRPFRSDRVDAPLRSDLLTLAFAALPLLYVHAFAASHLLAQRTAETGPLQRASSRFAGYVQGKSLSLLFGHSLGVDLYRAALFGTLLLALGLAGAQLRLSLRQRRLTAADLFLLAALFLLITLPWLPSDISGAYYFPERLILLIWVFALLAAAGWQTTPVAHKRIPAFWLTAALLLFVAAANCALLISADAALRPIALQAQALEHTSTLHPGELVLSLESTTLPPAKRTAPSWNPNYWMAVHAVRSRDAILANAPWLDSSIIPLAAQPALPAAQLPPQIANSPHALSVLLGAEPDLRSRLLTSVGAVSFNPADVQPASTPDALLGKPGAAAVAWSCQKTPDGVDQICQREPR